MSSKQWKRIMDGCYRRKYAKASCDLTSFYIELTDIAKQYILKGELKEGETYSFPLSDNTKYVLTFRNYGTSVDVFNLDDPLQKETILNFSASGKKDYSNLTSVSKQLKMSGTFIGEKYPDALKKVVKTMVPGQIISFTDGCSYVCTQNADDKVFLIDVFDGDIDNFSLKYIKNKEPITLEWYNDAQMQAFYNKNNKYLTERIEFSYSLIDDARANIKRIENELKPKETKVFDIGPLITLRVTMANKNRPTWYDQDGNILKISDVVIIFGLLNNNIHKREYVRTSYDDHLKIGEDVKFEKKMEKLTALKQFDAMYEEMTKYVAENKNSLSIHTKMFDSENDYKATNIVFAEKDGQVKAFSLTYKDNDFNAEILSVKDLQKEDFCSICKRIYAQNHHILKTKTEEKILSDWNLVKETMTQTQKNIVKNTGQNIADRDTKVIGTEDISVTPDEITNFIKSFLDKEVAKDKISKEKSYEHDDR